MELLAHANGITLRMDGYPPTPIAPDELIQIAANMARRQWRLGFIQPRCPDPNP